MWNIDLWKREKCINCHYTCTTVNCTSKTVVVFIQTYIFLQKLCNCTIYPSTLQPKFYKWSVIIDIH